MSSQAGNAIVTKAKAIYGNRLKSEDYQELVKKKSVSEVAKYLKSHSNYKETLSDIQEDTVHRGQLEEWIKKNNFKNIIKLIMFMQTKDKDFYELNIVMREIDLILATIRSVISGSITLAIAEFPIFFRRHANFDIDKLSRVDTFSGLINALEGTMYHHVLIPFEEKDPNQIKYVEIERALDDVYYERAFQVIDKYYSGKLKRNLYNIFLTKIELSNIVKIYRLKKFYQASPEQIKSALITSKSRIVSKRLTEIINLLDADDILKYLSKSELAKFTDEDDYVYIEYYSEKIKYNLAKRYMYFSNDAPEVFASFLILNEIERENLFNIIEGIRYNLNDKEIEKMLIY
ncbi:MAG: V-type ATPase subunit [Firmicutes bacterium]|nr:V-type ATPase subunit [Bacillota bacterium]